MRLRRSNARQRDKVDDLNIQKKGTSRNAALASGRSSTDKWRAASSVSLSGDPRSEWAHDLHHAEDRKGHSWKRCI